MSEQAERSAGLDFLRGALSLWVVLVHVVPWTTAAQGNDSVAPAVRWFADATSAIFQNHGETNPAVLMFIVLSGYCIQKSWSNNPNLRSFAIRRVFRIVPIFMIGILVGILGFVIAKSVSPLALAFSGTTSIRFTCVIAKATAVASLTPVFHPCTYAGNAPLLTVMVEIALYAVFPLLLWCGRITIIASCSACFVAALVVSAKYPSLYNWWQNSSLYGFLPYWWIGASFASTESPPRPKIVIWTFSIWALLTVLCYVDRTAICSELRKVPFCLLTAFAIIKIRNLRAPTFTTSIGKAGYSIYALHAPVLYILVANDVPWWGAMAACISFGMFCFYIIEQPLDQTGHSIAKRNARLLEP